MLAAKEGERVAEPFTYRTRGKALQDFIETVTLYYHTTWEEYEVTAEVCWVTDPAYGADADGRRGIPMKYVDEVTIVSIVNMFDEEVSDQYPGLPPVDTMLMDAENEATGEEH